MSAASCTCNCAKRNKKVITIVNMDVIVAESLSATENVSVGVCTSLYVRKCWRYGRNIYR